MSGYGALNSFSSQSCEGNQQALKHGAFKTVLCGEDVAILKAELEV
jgi:hypothetical protein